MYEKLVAIEVENESGDTEVWTIKRFITQEPHDREAVFSNELIFRPGGGAIARRIDNRTQTLADDAIADAHNRQEREVEEMRRRGLTQARTGGEQHIEPTGEQVGTTPAPSPARRQRRGSQTTEPQPAEA